MLNLNWTNVRAWLGGKLSQSQVDNINLILKEANEQGITNPHHLAYIFATVKHETGNTMEPIKEKGGNNYLFKMYDPEGDRPAMAKRAGNTTKGDGVKYAGRGHVQLTWKSNYKKFGDLLGIDLVNNPDLALTPEVSAKILVLGMRKGLFTGVSLTTYTKNFVLNFKESRRIINGTDKQDLIAKTAENFLSSIVVTPCPTTAQK